MAKVSSAQTLYSGPSSTSYVSTGVKIPASSTLSSVLWLESGYYYVEFGTTRGYIPESSVTFSSSETKPNSSSLGSFVRWNRNGSQAKTYYGPGSSYIEAGYIGAYEQVTYLGAVGGGYAFIEYSSGSKLKRAWVLADNLTGTTWTLSSGMSYTIQKSETLIGAVGTYNVLRYALTFTTAGSVTFSIPSSSYAWFSSNASDFNYVPGLPTIATLQTSTFSATVSSGLTYYLYVRYTSGEASGTLSVTVTPQTATKATYTLWYQYNSNGGSAVAAHKTETTTSDTTVYLSMAISSTVPTKTGYTFKYWLLDGVSYSPGQPCSWLMGSTTETKTFTAVWEASPTYILNIVYYYNDESGGSSVDVKYGDSNPISGTFTPPTITRDGYELLGWAESESATTAIYSAGVTYPLSNKYGSANGTEWALYAVWKVLPYTLTVLYNSNGGETAVEGKVIPSETSATISFTVTEDKPERTNYVFIGWSKSSTATTSSYEPGKTYSETITDSSRKKTIWLYAVWRKIDGCVYVYSSTYGWQKYETYVCTGFDSATGAPVWTRAEPMIYSNGSWKSVST